MKNEQDKKRIRELLFRRFDKSPAKGPEKAAPQAAVKEPPPSPPSYTPPTQEPKDKTLKYAIGAFVCVIAVILLASLSNSNKFYFKQNEKMVELWQGRFAPMGERRVASFSDPKIMEAVSKREVCTKKQTHAVLLDHFIKRADEILNTDETPNLKTVKSYLTLSSRYARSESEREAINVRLNSIRFLVLLGKADLALNKGTVPELEAAKGYLTQAISVASTDLQKDTLMKRLAAVEYALATSKISSGLVSRDPESASAKGQEVRPGKVPGD